MVIDYIFSKKVSSLIHLFLTVCMGPTVCPENLYYRLRCKLIQYEIKCIDKEFMVSLGLEPGTLSTTRVWSNLK